MRALPFRTAPEGSVAFSVPNLSLDGGALAAPGEPVRGWDYLAQVTISGNVAVEVDELLAATRLDSADDLAAYMQVDCPATGYRRVVEVPLPGTYGGPVTLQHVIPPHTVASELEVRYGVLLVTDLPESPELSPHLRGSRVFSDPKVHRFLLEGDGAGFPIEAFDFSLTGYPPGAPWHLKFNTDSPAEPFMGAVRLFINTAHPAAEALLSGRPGLERSVIFHGVLEQMLVTAAADWEHDTVLDWGEGSVGAVLEELAQTYLGGRDLASALQEVRVSRESALTKIREAASLLIGGAK